MVEVREVREDELDSMLDCMAAAYGIDKESWADGFYNGPYNDIRWKQVVVKDERVVSCLVIIPRRMYLGGSTVTLGGIAGVATLPEERCHGYAGMLMTDSVRTLREMGFATSGLYPFSFKYYRKFGWEFASHRIKLDIKPEYLPTYTEAVRVRPFQDADLPDLMRIYQEHFSSLAGPFVRDERHWQRHILPRVQEKLMYDNGGVQGYVLGHRSEEEGERCFNACEMVAATDEARRGVVGYLAQRAGEVGRIHIPSCNYNLEAFGLLTPRAHWEEGYDARGVINIGVDFQFRIHRPPCGDDCACRASEGLQRRSDAGDGG